METFVKVVDANPVETWQEFAEIIQNSPGIMLQLEVDRNGDSVMMDVVPKTLEEKGKEYGQIGVKYTSPVEKGALKAVQHGAEETIVLFKRTADLLGQLVTGQLSFDALSGPVGIYQATGEVAQHGI